MNSTVRRLIGLAVALQLVAACGSDVEPPEASSAAESAIATPVATTVPVEEPDPSVDPVEPTVPGPGEPTVPATAAPAGATPTSEHTDDASGGSDPTPTTQEVEAVEPLQGGNVGRVYSGDEYPSELSGVVAGMITDTAGLLGVEEGDVAVITVAEVTWSDASLGCPQPGMVYAQVVTDGLQVVLQADDLLFDYRADGVDSWMLCSQSVVTDKSTAGLYEITEDGTVVQVETPTFDEDTPTQGTNPPDE